MANKRRRLQRQPGKSQQKPKPNLRASGKDDDATKKKKKKKKKAPQPKKRQPQQHHQHEEPTIPFDPQDRILLVGEADLSFAASIIEHHGCRNVTATVLEKNHAELVEKYPSVDDNIAVVEGTKTGDPAAGSKNSRQTDAQQDDDHDHDHDHDHDDNNDQDNDSNQEDRHQVASTPLMKKRNPMSAAPNSKNNNNKLFYSIDATKLPNSVARPPHNHIVFNFPHVGGKSTDVNRQVRYNQELLVSFFGSALKALAPGGSIVVTLFEGEPYTLWNIRDLGRHAGLQVEKSFRFQAGAYPGYKHARTLGVVKNKKGEVGGGWKGEERASRSYVFRRKGEVSDVKRKRPREDDSSDEDV